MGSHDDLLRNRNFRFVAAVLLGSALLLFVWHEEEPAVAKLAFSELMEHVETGNVLEIEIFGNEIRGQMEDGESFTSRAPILTSEWISKLREHGVTVRAHPAEDESLRRILLGSLLPLLLFVGIFFFVMRQSQGGGGGFAASMGKARAKLQGDDDKRVSFADVAGVEEAKLELEEIVAFLHEPRRFTRLGGRLPKGVLLVGPPGTGKTLLARAVAGEAQVPFFSLSGSEFVEMFVGVGASRVRDLFKQARDKAPCIIFIDEIDAVGRHRGAGIGGGHDEREQTLNQLLVEMDGFESGEGVILMAATNRPDVLDPALLRPGRFDRQVVVSAPDLAGRVAILKIHTRRVPLAEDVDLEVQARGSIGFTGADLENLVNEAALGAARRDAERVGQCDFEEARDKVMMGSERRSLVVSAADRRIAAYHEAGHAVVALLTPEDSDPVHKVTIIPRGTALGLTQILPSEDRLSTTRSRMLAQIRHGLAGRAAEELVFSHFSTGAAGDLASATQCAHRMICRYGMSERIGPVCLEGSGSEELFLGRDWMNQRRYGEKQAAEIDNEVSRMLRELYDDALRRLREHRNLLERVAEALLEHETLDSGDLALLMAG
jgi:cell division protease FtsH